MTDFLLSRLTLMRSHRLFKCHGFSAFLSWIWPKFWLEINYFNYIFKLTYSSYLLQGKITNSSAKHSSLHFSSATNNSWRNSPTSIPGSLSFSSLESRLGIPYLGQNLTYILHIWKCPLHLIFAPFFQQSISRWRQLLQKTMRQLVPKMVHSSAIYRYFSCFRTKMIQFWVNVLIICCRFSIGTAIKAIC